MDLIDHALRCTHENGRFSYVSPTYSQSKEIAWSYLKRFTADIPGIEQRESDLMVNFPNGARVRLYGADTFDRLRGGYNHGLIMDEFADIDPRAWPEVLRPSLADHRGWAVFIGTPKGHNHLYDTFQAAKNNDDWFSAILKASETGILPQSELDDMRQGMSADAYSAEMECDFDAAIRGAIYRTELAALESSGRLCSVPYDPAVPVWVSWDLGVSNSTALWCAQIVGREVHIIDHYEASGESLVHYVQWLDSKPYRYGIDLLPHDASARELGSGKTREEILRANGRKVRVLPAQSIEDGIEAVKMMLGRCWFDRDRTVRGRECLAHYRRDFNDKMGIYKTAPVHDWASDSSDSLRYMAMGLRETSPRSEPAPRPRPLMRAGNSSWMGS
jgi:phage terminase large subunit